MTCGLPTFATNRGGPAEIIEDGISGARRLRVSSNSARFRKQTAEGLVWLERARQQLCNALLTLCVRLSSGNFCEDKEGQYSPGHLASLNSVGSDSN